MLDELKADIDAALTGALRTGTLRRVLPGEPDGAGGTLPGSTVTYPFEGVVGSYGIIAAGIGGIPRTDAKVEILASSLSTEPLRLDTLTIESKWWQITETSRDPAGAWWELQCQSVSAPA